MGFGPDAANQPKRDQDLLREANEARLRAELEPRFETGGLPEAMIRSLIYIRQPEHSIDERGFTVAKAVRDARPAGLRLSQPVLKQMFRDQFLLLAMDQDRAVRALPGLLPTDPARRQEALADILRVLSAPGPMSEGSSRRLAEVQALFAALGATAPGATAAAGPKAIAAEAEPPSQGSDDDAARAKAGQARAASGRKAMSDA